MTLEFQTWQQLIKIAKNQIKMSEIEIWSSRSLQPYIPLSTIKPVLGDSEVQKGFYAEMVD